MACFSFLLIVLMIILQKCDNVPANCQRFFISLPVRYSIFFLIPLHISKKDDYEET